jgi:glycosyltransferase involved in cell wall biosynthesis
MKIINIVPGFGGTFYCGNCLRDSGLMKALKHTGHEAHTLPIYLPLFASNNQDGDSDIPVFYGAVNIYLKQNFKIFRHVPDWLHKMLDSSPVLRYAARKAGSTRAHGLEEMTISMLKGHEGYQKEELDHLVSFLRDHEKPDVVHLSNALLLGLANRIRTEVGAHVVCSLQDEDVWVDAMAPEYQEKVWQMMSEKGKDVAAFVAVSDYFASLMHQKMDIPPEKMHVIHIGVDAGKYVLEEPQVEKPVIGYLSRTNEENGFGVLIDAFIMLKDSPSGKNARLRVSGGKTSDDNKFIRQQFRKLRRKGYHKDVEFRDDFVNIGETGFFKGLTLLSVPVLKGEAFGMYQLESLASGIPLVQPALGAFPEIAKLTGGGTIYQPNSPEKLAAAWGELLTDPERITEMSRMGRLAVEDKFSIAELTNKMIDVYKSLG